MPLLALAPSPCDTTASWWICLGKVLRTKVILFLAPNTIQQIGNSPGDGLSPRLHKGRWQVASFIANVLHFAFWVPLSEVIIFSDLELYVGIPSQHTGTMTQSSEYKVHERPELSGNFIWPWPPSLHFSAPLNSGHQMLSILLYSKLFLFFALFPDGSQRIFWLSNLVIYEAELKCAFKNCFFHIIMVWVCFSQFSQFKKVSY